MEQERAYLELRNGAYIKIEDGYLIANDGQRTVTDEVDNFILSAFIIISALGIHGVTIMLQNYEQEFRWCYDVTLKKSELEYIKKEGIKVRDIMARRGLFENRNHYDIHYNLNEKEKAMIYKPIEKGKQKCPKCGRENYHAFVEEKVIRERETKKTVSLNLNPLKPFTVFEEKEKVVREPRVKHVSKFVCDDCGMIFKPRV